MENLSLSLARTPGVYRILRLTSGPIRIVSSAQNNIENRRILAILSRVFVSFFDRNDEFFDRISLLLIVLDRLMPVIPL